MTLPIEAVVPALLAELAASGLAVLQAPPGAGKTTHVPLALLASGLLAGRVLMLEPRRLAARAAAERMAETLGEPVGQRVGYRIRGEAKISPATRIEVVTEGILTRMLQSDPALPGVSAVIFDEFHERSLNADLGLALTWEVRGALRPDLMILVMSATLDAAPVAALLKARVITSAGRAFAVETRWLDRPLAKAVPLEQACAELVLTAMAETEGGVLVFLPGEREIRRLEALLGARVPAGCAIRPLYGAMEFAAQRAAIAPDRQKRKIVLATAIAETSLTIEDVRVVVDAGRARRARFDPASGMARLVTERVTRAEADQRRGRAGRVAPGVCYRLWTRGEEGALAAFPPAEIEAADLTGFALELALWGSGEAGLALLTPPNPGALAEARGLLTTLEALDPGGRITAHGRALAALPLHPRLGHMLLRAGKAAAPMAALLAERDPIKAAVSDLGLRLEAVRDPSGFERARPYPLNRAIVERVRQETRRLERLVPSSATTSPAEQAALAYPDRIGQRRKGEAARFLLSGGKGAVLEPGDPLAAVPLLVATDLDGDPREARIRQAILLPEASLRRLFASQIAWSDICEWSRRDGRVLMRQQERFGAIALADRAWAAPPDLVARAALDGVRDLGLAAMGWSATALRFRARVVLLQAQGSDLPDLSDAGLLAGLEHWLLPHLGARRTAEELKALDLTAPLQAMLSQPQHQLLDRLAPHAFTTPLGRQVPIDYSGAAPAIELRLQELFGVTTHPTVGPQRLALRLTLLSPSAKPIQITQDLPGFWATSYADVRRDMRGRYPRHPWPENPHQAEPTQRAKPRGT